MKGRTLSNEHKESLSLAKTGTEQSNQTKAKIKDTMLGDNFNYFKKNHPTIPKTNNSRSHLTAIDVKAIRDRYSNDKNASIRVLARDFNVSRHTIHSIVTYKLWT